jgi:hypothetical protein
MTQGSPGWDFESEPFKPIADSSLPGWYLALALARLVMGCRFREE